MLHTTRAVVLRTFRHGDNSTVLRAFTEAFGTRSYMVRSGKRGTAAPALLQPLGRVELVVTEHHSREVQQVREARIVAPYVGIPGDPRRSMLLLFAQEVFYRTLREGAPDPTLFRFVMQTLEAIDTSPALGPLPVELLLGLALHLGFLPQAPQPGEDRFDLREGCFFRGEADHAFCLDPVATAPLIRLLGATGSARQLTAPERRTTVEQLLLFFRFHVDGFGELRSPEVLHELLR